MRRRQKKKQKEALERQAKGTLSPASHPFLESLTCVLWGGPGLPPAMPSARRRANNPQRKGHNNQPVVADPATAEGGGEAGRAQQSEGGGGGGGGSFMKEGAWGGGR